MIKLEELRAALESTDYSPEKIDELCRWYEQHDEALQTISETIRKLAEIISKAISTLVGNWSESLKALAAEVEKINLQKPVQKKKAPSVHRYSEHPRSQNTTES